MDIEELIKQLDQTHPGWDIYRVAVGYWGITVNNSGQRFVATAPTIAEAFAKAIAWVPLPLVPKMPPVFSACELEVCERGGRWEIRRWGTFFSGDYSAKKVATESMEMLVRNSEKAVQQWEQEWGWVKDKIEGVDFRFKQ